MIDPELTRRVEYLEETVDSLRDLPERTAKLEARMGAVETQIVQLRTEMHDEFSAIRREMVTKADSEAFATKTDLEAFATKRDLEAFATKRDLEAFATKTDLEAFATKADLEAFATHAELTFATKGDLAALEATTKLEFAAVRSELRSAISAVRTELREDIAGMGRDLAGLFLESQRQIRALIEDVIARMAMRREGSPPAS